MGGIGIIHNPFARCNLKRPWIARDLKNVLKRHGILCETRNVHELTKVAQAFLDQEIEIMAVNGGDGTLHFALSEFVNIYGNRPLPKLMPLRGGTMNIVSNFLRLKGKTLDIVKGAVAKYKSGEPFKEMKQHLLKVNERYGFMSGAGVVARFLDSYYLGPGTGPIQASKMVARIIVGAVFRTKYVKNMFSPTQFQVKVDSKDLGREDYMFILGCTIQELGLGFTPTPHAYDKPGHFHFIAASMRPIEMVPKLPSIWLGRDISHPNMYYNGVAKRVVVEPRGKMRWMVDGEMYDTEEPLYYSVGPTITIVSP
jgi:diacylglycerol kinase (ATP)